MKVGGTIILHLVKKKRNIKSLFFAKFAINENKLNKMYNENKNYKTFI